MRNPALDVVTDELKNVGIRHTIDDDGPHIKIKWWHRGRPRVVVVAKTTSDHRAPLNNRSLARRILREDGYNLDEAPKQSPRVEMLEKAMNLPGPVDPVPDRLERLEGTVKTLSDLLMNIAPAFDNILGDVEKINRDNPEFYKLKISSKKLGVALAALYSAGLTPYDIDIETFGGAATITPKPQFATVEHSDKKRTRDGSKGRELLDLLRNKPMSTSQIADVMNIVGARDKTNNAYNALSMRLSMLRRQKLIDNDGRGRPWRVLETV